MLMPRAQGIGKLGPLLTFADLKTITLHCMSNGYLKNFSGNNNTYVFCRFDIADTVIKAKMTVSSRVNVSAWEPYH